MTSPTFKKGKIKNKDGYSIHELQEEVEKLEVEKARERFLSSLIFLMLFDFIVFQEVGDWGGVIVIGILQILLILFIGLFLEIKELNDFVNKIFSAVHSQKPDATENPDSTPPGNNKPSSPE